MKIVIDYELWAYVVVALGLSLMINTILLIRFIGKRYPRLLFKED